MGTRDGQARTRSSHVQVDITLRDEDFARAYWQADVHRHGQKMNPGMQALIEALMKGRQTSPPQDRFAEGVDLAKRVVTGWL